MKKWMYLLVALFFGTSLYGQDDDFFSTTPGGKRVETKKSESHLQDEDEYFVEGSGIFNFRLYSEVYGSSSQRGWNQDALFDIHWKWSKRYGMSWFGGVRTEFSNDPPERKTDTREIYYSAGIEFLLHNLRFQVLGGIRYFSSSDDRWISNKTETHKQQGYRISASLDWRSFDTWLFQARGSYVKHDFHKLFLKGQFMYLWKSVDFGFVRSGVGLFFQYKEDRGMYRGYQVGFLIPIISEKKFFLYIYGGGSVETKEKVGQDIQSTPFLAIIYESAF